MNRSFINKLSKEELTECLKQLNQEYTGSMDELRAILRNYMNTPNLPSDHVQLLKSYSDSKDTEKLEVPKHPRSPSGSSDVYYQSEEKNSYASICDTVRKWNVKYDGGKDPLMFLERIEELGTCYGISKENLLVTMPELLRQDALSWYRNNKSLWEKYSDFIADFKLFFLPPRFFQNLEDDIRNRKQRQSEKFVEFVTHIQSLMRWSKMSSKTQLDRIYNNCLPDYKLYIKPRDFTTLRDLILAAQEFESVQADRDSQPKPSGRLQTAVAQPGSAYVCFRCGEPGHHKMACTNPQVLFCWICHKRGVRTIECCKKPTGNEPRGPSM